VGQQEWQHLVQQGFTEAANCMHVGISWASRAPRTGGKLRKFRNVGMETAGKAMAMVRPEPRKEYSQCCKHQKAQRQVWVTASAGGEEELMKIVGDIVNKSSQKEGLADLLLSSMDEQHLTSSKTFKEKLRHLEAVSEARGRGEELDIDLTLALFFETDLSWEHYNSLTSVFRKATASSDLRFPSRNRLFNRYKALKVDVVHVVVPSEDGNVGEAVVLSPAAGWKAALERVQQAADEAARAHNSFFEAFVNGTAKVIFNLAADGFSVPDFDKKLVSYLQANLRVLMPGAQSSGLMSAHIPLMLARCKETYEAYEAVWPHVEAPFLDAQGRPRRYMEVMWQGRLVRVGIEYKLSGDLKGSLILLGRQPPQSGRPCTSCFEQRHLFGSISFFHCREEALRSMSMLHHRVVQSFHASVPCLDGASVMDYVVNKVRLTSLTCAGLSRALLSNNLFMLYMNNLDELYYLSRDGCLNCRFVRIDADGIENVPAEFTAKVGSVDVLVYISQYVAKWGQVSVFLKDPSLDKNSWNIASWIQCFIWSIDCCIVEEVHGFECYWCPRRPVLDDVLRGVASTQRLLSGIVMSCVRPSLSALIEDPSKQVIMETLHCILNLLRTHFEALKLMCNKFIAVEEVVEDGRKIRKYRLKSKEDSDRWDSSVRRDNSAKKDRWREQGAVLDDDLEEVLGFKEPMQGWHGNLCFKVLDKWEAICEMPVLKLLDSMLGVELCDAAERIRASGWVVDSGWREKGVLRQWLGGLNVTCQQIRRTRPCVAALRVGIDGWFVVVACINAMDSSLYALKAYDHFCGVHVLPVIAREGNVVQFATFSTEHDNSVIRRDLRSHTTAGGGRAGGVGALEQLFQRRVVSRSLLVQSKRTWAPEQRCMEIKSSCSCDMCKEFFSKPVLDGLPDPPSKQV
jgi:hypothetical protein